MMLGEIDTSNDFFCIAPTRSKCLAAAGLGNGGVLRAAAVTIVASEIIGRRWEKAQSRYKDGPGIPIVIVPSGL